jgi:adapter protein MecA 1/2
MFVEKLDDNRVRGILTATELVNLNLSMTDFYTVNEKSKNIIDKILDYAVVKLKMDMFGPIAVNLALKDTGILELEVIKVSVAEYMDKFGVAQLISADDEPEDDYEGYDGYEDDDRAYLDALDDEANKELIVSVVYMFRDIEDVIALAIRLDVDYELEESRLFHYQNRYYLSFENVSKYDSLNPYIEPITLEYGEYSNRTLAVLAEYGNTICENNAIKNLATNFSKKD